MSDKKADENPKISYSTDYMLDKIQNPEKMVSTDKRLSTIDEHSELGDEERSSVMDDYFSENGTNIADSYSKNNNSDNEKSIFDENKNSDNTKDYKYDGEKKYTNKKIYEDLFGDVDDFDKLTEQQQLIKKMDLITQLGELAKYSGIKLTQSYSLESDYYLMKCELMIHKNIQHKDWFVNKCTLWTCHTASFVESCAKSYDIGLNLDGWSNGIRSQSLELSQIWSEMYVKYGSPGKDSSPEMRLLYCLAVSPLMYDDNKKREEEYEQKLRQYQKQEDAQRQINQFKQMNFAANLNKSNSNNMKKKWNEHEELIRQQKELIRNQQLELERERIEKERMKQRQSNGEPSKQQHSHMVSIKQKDDELKRKEFEKMNSFYKENEFKRTDGIKSQLNAIKQNINNIHENPKQDMREKEIREATKKMENKKDNSTNSSYSTTASASSIIMNKNNNNNNNNRTNNNNVNKLNNNNVNKTNNTNKSNSSNGSDNSNSFDDYESNESKSKESDYSKTTDKSFESKKTSLTTFSKSKNGNRTISIKTK